jgi:hypothetical protein
MSRDRTPGKQKPAAAIIDDQLPRGPVSGQHRLWGDGRAGVRDHGGGDRKRPGEAQRELGASARPVLKKQAQTIESYRLHAWQQIPIVELQT